MSLLGKLSALLGVLLCLVAASLPADGWQNGQLARDGPTKGPLKGDAIEVAGLKPAAPAALKAGEKLEVRFSYSLESADQVLILVHPITKSPYTPGPVSVYKKGKGQGVGWFAFKGPASIEELQIVMFDLKSKRKLVVLKHPVKAEWK